MAAHAQIEELARMNRVDRSQKPTGAALEGGSLAKRTRDGRRLVDHWAAQNPDAEEIDWAAVFSAENMKAACEWDYPAARSGDKPGTASKTVDTVAISAMFFLRQRCFQANGAGAPLPQEAQLAMQCLERAGKEHEKTRADNKEPPPPLSIYHDFGEKLHAAALTHDQQEDRSYEQLSLATMALVTIFGMAARSGAMRDWKWGQEITLLEDGDWLFKIGKQGASKNSKYCEFKLSDLTPLGQVGLLRPDLVSTALKTLYDACDKVGYVFSRTASGASRFGDERLRKFLKDHELTIGKLRSRLETDADQLGREGRLSATDRELVSYVLQHSPSVADADYVHPESEDQGSAFTEHAQRDDDDDGGEPEGGGGGGEPEGGGGEPEGGGGGPVDGGGHGDAAGHIDWVARVAVHTERMYDLITDGDCHSSKTLIQLNMALAMASYNHLYNQPPFDEEMTMVRHAGAACEIMNAMKRRRIQ